MASEVSELSSIKDEDLLRRMWQQTEDFCRKKEIRAHMYKLREERLRNFYTGDMDTSMSKSPMIPSHGDSLADQSFQSLKAKEIRDCASPTRHIQYDMATPDTSGWNVVTTSQISSDGKEQCNTTLATTDAVKEIHGGKSTFSGKNEQTESHRHDGDDKNYTTTSGHASNTVLEEHIVTGDAKNGRKETKSNTTNSSSKTVTSSKYQSEDLGKDDFVQEFEGVLNSARRSVRDGTNNEQFERIHRNDFDNEYINSKTTNKSSTSSNQQSSFEIRRNSASSTTSSVDAKKKYQRETEYLANAPGEIISRSVEYPDANTKVITETKTLPDGSTVTTTKYESRAASSATTSKSSKQEKSSTSRFVTEDRAERNRIEIITGNNQNVIGDEVKSKLVLVADDIEGMKSDSKETLRETSVKKEFYCNENVRKDDTQSLNDRSKDKTKKVVVEVTNNVDQQSNMNKLNSQSETTSENIYDQQSTETHKTVKKDLTQDHERYTKARAYETDLSDVQFDRQPVQEEVIVPKKQIYHVCSPDHDHSPKPVVSQPLQANKRISVDHNPTHDAFARSLRSDTTEADNKRSVQSSTHSVKTNSTYTDREFRSPSRDTNVSDTSKFSSTTVTKSHSPNRQPSYLDKRKPTISSETIDISSAEPVKSSKKTVSTEQKNSQTYVSNKKGKKSQDHYDHPRNNQPITSNTAPADMNENSSVKNSSYQPSYSRPTASSVRHNNKSEHVDDVSKSKKEPHEKDEPIEERPSNDRRQPSRTDSKITFTTTLTRETKDYGHADKLSLKRQSASRQTNDEQNFDSGRSNSPTSSVSDIEYVNFAGNSQKVTDLDEVEILINVRDKSIHKTNGNEDTQDGLFLSTHKKRVSSPSMESDTDTIVEHENHQGKEPFYLIDSHVDVKETRREKPPLTRSETYEERCRSMLGMTVQTEEIANEQQTVKNSKQASFDLIKSEQKVEAKTPSRSPTKSPDRKSVTSVTSNVNRSPSRSPDRKVTTDTFTHAKSNHPSSSKSTSKERNEKEEKFVSDTVILHRKSSSASPDRNISSNRSNSNSPDRKRKSDLVPEATKQFINEESRSNSFTTRSTKTKETSRETATSTTTREVSPKRDQKHEFAGSSPSPKHSPNRSANTSPARNRQGTKEYIVEATQKMLHSENDFKNVSGKGSKSELKKSVVENKELDVKIVTAPKHKKVNTNSFKSPTGLDRTPSHTKIDETFTDTSETFFSETKTDTIKRRPVAESKSPVGKSNVKSPDRKPTTTTNVLNNETSRKSVSEENKSSARKSSATVDNYDVNKVKTNTFTRKKPSESNEPLSSPTKPKGKLTTIDNSGKHISSSTSKTKSNNAKIGVATRSKQTNIYSTDDDSDVAETAKKSTKKVPITSRKDSAPVYRSTKVDKEVKMARSTSEHFSATSRKGSKPEIDTPKSPTKFEKRPTKCMTTKTINLSTANTLNSEDMENVIIDIQQAKSSREPTPNRIIPTPVSPEEDTGKPRYPDTVHEPDDERPQRRRIVKNIPIFEEDKKEFISCHITEVSENYDATDSDECLLSVSDKVTKFSTKVTSPTNEKFKRTVADKFTEDIEDERQLNVQGKVSKFSAIAEKVNTSNVSSDTKMESKTSSKVNKKVAQFNEKEVKNSKISSKQFHTEAMKSADRVKTRLDFEDIDETLKSDECMLSVSDKVNKFVAAAETLTSNVPQISDVKSPELVAKVHRQVSQRDHVTEKDNDRRIPPDHHDSVIEVAPKGKITDRYIPNKPKQTSALPSVPISLSSIDVVKKAKSIFESDNSVRAPKQRDILSRPSVWDQKRSEAAKDDVKLTDIGVFKKRDDSNPEIDSKAYSRSPEIKRSSLSPEPRKSSRSPEQQRHPSYVYDHSSSQLSMTSSRFEENEPKMDSHATKKGSLNHHRSSSPPTKQKSNDSPDTIDRNTIDKRSYMNHTIASLEHIRRDSIEINRTNTRKGTQDDEVDQVETNRRGSIKFGVELKRTNSQQSAGRRKSSCSEIPHVEEIFELGLLERMLETVVGYEQRRRIRAQMRLVKKQMQDEEKTKNVKKTTKSHQAEFTTESRRKQEPSPIRKTSPLRKANENVNEHISQHTKYTKVDRTTSPVRKSSPQRQQQIDGDEYITSKRVTTNEEHVSMRRSSPNRKSFIDGNSNAYRNGEMQTYVQKSRSPSPRSNKVTISANLRNSDMKQVNSIKSADDDKPIWARKNILTKASDSTRTFTSSGKKTTVTKVQKQKTIEQNDDCVTSSYGIGPTDEDGKPLFGIRALKKKAPTSQTNKVSGTIIQETLFSENGSTPIGNRTTTMYSSDPQDVRHFVETNGTAADIRNRLIERENNRRGITSVTTSHKIEGPFEELPVSDNKQPKIGRRGSVKELSEKFQKETVKSSEKTTSSYPKAGLILRTQTSRESTPGANSSIRSGSADFDDCDIEVRCSSLTRLRSDDEIVFNTSTSMQQHESRSFLNTNSRVTDVQDVLSRMRNADNVIEDGDTEEDKEARALLNKFLGASVLMSGMESMVPKEITKIVGKPTTHAQTTHITKKYKSTSSPSTTREIKTRDIDSIWDEQLLKHLLDQSGSYEERRKIRARLRQVMAEKEACADIVASVTAELKQQKQILEKETSKKMEIKPTVKKEKSEEEEEDDDEYEYEEVEVTDEEEEESEHETKVEVSKSNVNKKTTSTTAGVAAAASATVTKTTIKVEEKKESQGESLLLPLLQGLLHKKTAQHSSAIKSSNKQEHTVTHIEDSGTESGEDLKLLAAGLHDHMNKESVVPGIKSNRESIVQADLLAEVTTALNRLQATLRDGSDVDLDMNKRNALLTLVSRLQIGLISPDKITDQSISGLCETIPVADSSSLETEIKNTENGKRLSGIERFAKRRNNRQIRHTVGVSQEELADARRYIEELSIMENLSNSASTADPTTTTATTTTTTADKHQAPTKSGTAEASVLLRPNKFIPNSFASQSAASETVVQMRDKKPRYKFTRQSLSFEQADILPVSRRPFSEALNVNQLSQPEQKRNAAFSIQNVMQKVGKFSKAAEMERPDYSSEEEHISSNKGYSRTSQHSVGLLNSAPKCRRSRTPPGKATDEKQQNKPGNRFINKKLKMKRANTIDIPKTCNYFGGEGSDDDQENDYRLSDDSPVGLKGTIQPNVKVAPKKVVPTFKPKTENDHKFLAFLQKQNTKNNVTWTNPNRLPQPTNSHNWSNAFGNIKNTFESGNEPPTNRKPPMAGLSSARNFWKQNETSKPAKAGTRNTLFSNILTKQNSLDEKSSYPNVVIGSLRIRDGITNGNPGIETIKIVTPKPIAVNEFSHAPLSAFQPIQRKIDPPSFKPIPDPKLIPNINTVSQLTSEFQNKQCQQKPPPLTSPTRNLTNSFSPHNQPKSPTTALPWNNSIKADHRVLNIAASKFDSNSPQFTDARISPRGSSFRSFGPPRNLPNNTTGARLKQKRGSLPNDTSYSYFNEQDVPNFHQTQLNTNMNENIVHHPLKLQQGNYFAPSLPNLSNNVQERQQHRPPLTLSTYEAQNNYSNKQSPQPYYSQPPPPYTPPKSPTRYQTYPQPPSVFQSVKSPMQRTPDTFRQPLSSFHTSNRSFDNDSPLTFAESQRLDKLHQTQSYRAPPPSYQQQSAKKQVLSANYPSIPPPNYQSPQPNFDTSQSNFQNNYQSSMSTYQPSPPQYPADRSPSNHEKNPSSIPPSHYQPQLANYRPERKLTYDSPTTDTTEFPAYPYTCTDYTQPACVSTYIPQVTVTMDPSDSLTNPSAEPIVLSNSRPIFSPNNKPELLTIFDYPSSSDHTPQSSISPQTLHDTLDEMEDLELQEYTAKTQVMRGPVSQTAVTIANKVTSRNGMDGKGSEAAMSLQSVLKKIKPKSPDARAGKNNKFSKDMHEVTSKTLKAQSINIEKNLGKQQNNVKHNAVTAVTQNPSFKAPIIIETPSTPLTQSKKPNFPSNVVYNNVSSHASNSTKLDNVYNKQSYSTQSIERSANGDTVLSSNFHIPVNTTMYQNDAYHPPAQGRSPVALSKSDSWHQICQHSQKPPSPHNLPDQTRQIQRTKSGHSLSIPKQFEAGIKKTEVTEKQKTVAAYFSGQKSPQSLSRSSSQQNVDEPQSIATKANNTSSQKTTTIRKKSQITRIKTSEKASTSKQRPSSGLARSHTMPHVHNLNYLDETNVEDAFEDLFNESMS